MTYNNQWKAISSRIHGLVQAGTLHAQFLSVRSSDSYGSAKILRGQSKDILNDLKAFREGFSETLSSSASAAIERFETTAGPLIYKEGAIPDAAQEQVWAFLIAIAAFEAELTFLLSDTQTAIRSLSERAFQHLQRSIVADEDFRRKWQSAFKAGEVPCERLGAVHLLLHGVWAFKIDAAGARTDLVFQEPSDLLGVQRYVAGLVLTEWKKAATATEAYKRFGEAREQAKRYARGPLIGTELTGYRYAVVVTEHQIEIPPDIRDGDIVYRHINIAVEPRVPSKC